MFEGFLKKKVTVSEAMEKVDRLKLLKDYHWERYLHHDRIHKSLLVQLSTAQGELRVAEQIFMKATLEE